MKPNPRSPISLGLLVRLVITVTLVIASFALWNPSALATASPHISTDQSSYQGGDYVLITGSGWQPGESVNVKATSTFGFQAGASVVAKADGSFLTWFLIGPDPIPGTMTVAAIGSASGSAPSVTVNLPGSMVPIYSHFHLGVGHTDAPSDLAWSVSWAQWADGTNGCIGDPMTTGTAYYVGDTLVGGREPLTTNSYSDYIMPLAVNAPGYKLSYWSSAPDATGPPSAVNWPCHLSGGAFAPTTWFGFFEANPQASPTTVRLTSNANPARYGDDVMLRAVVSASTGSAAPTGSVSFLDTDGASPQRVCASVPLGGDASASCDLGSDVRPGSHTYRVDYVPADSAQFQPSSSGEFTEVVQPLTQTIIFPVPSATYGQPDSDPGASASSGLPIRYQSSTPSTCDITSGGLLRVLAAGDCTITAFQDGNDIYTAADSVTDSFTVNKAPLVVTASDAAVTYGSDPPQITPSYRGFVGSDDESDLDTAPTCSTTYAKGLGVAGSPYATTCSGGSDSNYSFSYVDGNVTVGRAPLTVRATDATKLLNAPNPPFSGSVTGLLNGDQVSLGFSTVATQGSPVGSYAIVPQVYAPQAVLDNYQTPTLIDGTLNIVYAAAGACDGAPGHTILQPVNPDGSSVFKKGTTIPLKFRVCDAKGTSIGNGGVASGPPQLVSKTNGAGGVDESIYSATPDTAFRWDQSSQQWIYNLATSNLTSGVIYTYKIVLDDGSSIPFIVGIR